MRPCKYLPASAAVLALCASAVATSTHEPIAEAASASSHTIRITPGVWLARLGGESKLRRSVRTTLDLEEDLDLRDLEATFNAELSIRKHDIFDLQLSGFSFSTDASGTFEGSGAFGDIQFNDGDPFRASFDLNSVNMELRFALFNPVQNSDKRLNSDGRERVRFRAGPLVGARYVNVDQTVERLGGIRESTGGDWLAVHGGVHFELMFRPEIDLPLFDRFSLDASASAGPAFGGDGGLVLHVQSSIRVYVTENVAFLFGYRLVELDVKNNGYELNGGLQGLFVAGTISF